MRGRRPPRLSEAASLQRHDDVRGNGLGIPLLIEQCTQLPLLVVTGHKIRPKKSSHGAAAKDGRMAQVINSSRSYPCTRPNHPPCKAYPLFGLGHASRTNPDSSSWFALASVGLVRRVYVFLRLGVIDPGKDCTGRSGYRCKGLRFKMWGCLDKGPSEAA